MLRHSCANGRGMHAVCPSLIGMGTCSSSDNLDAHWRCGLLVVRSSASRYILFAHYRQGSAALWALGIGPMAEPYWQSARASSASVATANLGCPSALRPTLIGIKVHRCEPSGRGSAELWALGTGDLADAYWRSARASSATVASGSLGCPSALWPTLIGIKVHTFCALSPRLGGIMGARHRPYGRAILAVCPGLIANWFLVFLVIISMPIGVVAYAHRHQGT